MALFIEPSTASTARHDDQKGFFRQCEADCPTLLINPLLNKCLENYFDSGVDHYVYPFHYDIVAPVNIEDANAGVEATSLRFHSTSASWKQMLLLQPSPVKMAVVCQKRGSCHHTVQKEVKDGFRCGTIVDQLRSHWFGCPNCPIHPAYEPYDCDPYEEQAEETYWKLRVQGHPHTLRTGITGWEVLHELLQMESKSRRGGE